MTIQFDSLAFEERYIKAHGHPAPEGAFKKEYSRVTGKMLRTTPSTREEYQRANIKYVTAAERTAFFVRMMKYIKPNAGVKLHGSPAIGHRLQPGLSHLSGRRKLAKHRLIKHVAKKAVHNKKHRHAMHKRHHRAHHTPMGAIMAGGIGAIAGGAAGYKLGGEGRYRWWWAVGGLAAGHTLAHYAYDMSMRGVGHKPLKQL